MARKPQKKRTDTRRVVEAQVRMLGKDEARRKVCELVGHSRIVQLVREWRPDLGPGEYVVTFRCCGRCGVAVNDREDHLIYGSPRTMANRAKFKAFTWRDKIYAPSNPFSSESC